MHFDVKNNLIFLCVAGSHAYGTNTPDSDIDIRGVTFVPTKYRESPFYKFESLDGERDISEFMSGEPKYNGQTLSKHDTQIQSVTKFVKLAADANPNILETLFMPVEQWLAESDEWQMLHSARDNFLSQKVIHTYTGYAHSQLKKVKAHREWLNNHPTHEPTREEFGLPPQPETDIDTRNKINEEIDKVIRSWNMEDTQGLDGSLLDVIRERMFDYRLGYEVFSGYDDLTAASVKLNLSTEALKQIAAERKYKQAVKTWKQYQTWLATRNAKRSELEKKYGYDTKHGMHLIRLMRTGLELMQNKPLLVRRPDAEELISIRNGAWSYEKLLEEADAIEKAIYTAKESCKLPHGPDLETINNVLISILQYGDILY